MAGFEVADEANEWLLNDEDSTGEARQERKQPTPLPKLQIGVLLFYHLAEPITSQCIYPFINQVCVSPMSSVVFESSNPIAVARQRAGDHRRR